VVEDVHNPCGFLGGRWRAVFGRQGGGGGGGGVAEAGLAGAAGLVVEMVVGGAGDWHDVCLRSEEKTDD
jgi:hypothetical protein